MALIQQKNRPEGMQPLAHPVYSLIVKRVLDMALALLLLLPGAVLMLPITLWVRLDSPGPVFYRAKRGGYKGKPFMILKFRSMVVDADKTGGCTALNDSRVTRPGRFLRKTKLDEIPQLLNILKGDMSFIGPRPELLLYTDQYTSAQQCILWVRPGVTDNASLAFISQDELVGETDPVANYEKYILQPKNAMRVQYALSQSLSGDLTLLIKTVGSVLAKLRRTLRTQA